MRSIVIFDKNKLASPALSVDCDANTRAVPLVFTRGNDAHKGRVSFFPNCENKGERTSR